MLNKSGSAFVVMGMHLRLGLYEHYSASAIQAILNLLLLHRKELLADRNPDNIDRVMITSFEKGERVVGDPEKRNPKSRQTADDSMIYIVATLLRKAFEKYDMVMEAKDNDDLWKTLMLHPLDYGKSALENEVTKKLMNKVEYRYGGSEYEQKYPEGVPTSVIIKSKQL